MPAARRLWDSSVILGYLAGYAELRDDCEAILAQAERGEIELVVSAMAAVEVAYLHGASDQDAENRIREFLGRRYVIPVAIDVRLAAAARELVRRYRNSPSLKPADAIHLATAIQLGIPVLETADGDLLRFDGREGMPPLRIRRPLYEGTSPLPGFS